MIYAHSTTDIFRSPRLWLASKLAQATAAASQPHTRNLKNFRISKRPNRKAVFRSDGGPPEFCYRSLQRTVLAAATLGRPQAPTNDSQLVTEASLTKDSAPCKPVFAIVL